MIHVKTAKDGRKVVFNGETPILAQSGNAFKVLNTYCTFWEVPPEMVKSVIKFAMLHSYKANEAYNFLLELEFQYAFEYSLGGAKCSSHLKFTEELNAL